jgi:hypothetical protein
MATIMQPSQERKREMYASVKVMNFSEDKTFRDKYEGVYYEIPPKMMMPIPAYIVWHWVGDPSLRKDEKLWYKELNRLKSRRGEGTAHFDYWLKGGRLVVQELRNNQEGYYGILSFQKDRVVNNSVPISEELLANPQALPPLTPLTHISDEDVLNFFDGLVSTGPKGEVGGIESSESSDVSNAITFSTGPVSLGGK